MFSTSETVEIVKIFIENRKKTTRWLLVVIDYAI